MSNRPLPVLLSPAFVPPAPARISAATFDAALLVSRHHAARHAARAPVAAVDTAPPQIVRQCTDGAGAAA